VDLTDAERTVLLALDQEGLSDANQIATRVGLPLKKVREVLRQLIAKGLIGEIDGFDV